MRELVASEMWGDCGLVANMIDCCDPSTTDPFEGMDSDQQARAFLLARVSLNILTAGVTANCTRTIRPCSPSCAAQASVWRWSGLTWSGPGSEIWMSACGCVTSCGCRSTGALRLPGPIAEVTEVTIDGTALAEGDYWLDSNGLHRTDGTPWPTTQDMDAPLGSPDTFGVTYRPGYALGPLGELAYGALTCEMAKAVCGKKCSLPASVKSVARNGVVMELSDGLFPGGQTKIRSVDTFVTWVNPHALKSAPTVLTPEMMR